MSDWLEKSAFFRPASAIKEEEDLLNRIAEEVNKELRINVGDIVFLSKRKIAPEVRRKSDRMRILPSFSLAHLHFHLFR